MFQSRHGLCMSVCCDNWSHVFWIITLLHCGHRWTKQGMYISLCCIWEVHQLFVALVLVYGCTNVELIKYVLHHNWILKQGWRPVVVRWHKCWLANPHDVCTYWQESFWPQMRDRYLAPTAIICTSPRAGMIRLIGSMSPWLINGRYIEHLYSKG